MSGSDGEAAFGSGDAVIAGPQLMLPLEILLLLAETTVVIEEETSVAVAARTGDVLRVGTVEL